MGMEKDLYLDYMTVPTFFSSKKCWTPIFNISVEEGILKFEVAGVMYRGEDGKIRERNLLKFMNFDETEENKSKNFPVIFKAEPENPYDEYAIKIFVKNPEGKLIEAGYVPRRPTPKTKYYQFNEWFIDNLKHFETKEIYYDGNFVVICRLKKEKLSEKEKIFEPFIEKKQNTSLSNSKTFQKTYSDTKQSNQNDTFNEIIFWFILGVIGAILMATWQFWLPLAIIYFLFKMLTSD